MLKNFAHLGLLGVLAAVFPSVAGAEIETDFSGHLKHQIALSDTKALDFQRIRGQDHPLTQTLDLRLNSKLRTHGWGISLQMEALGIGGNDLETRRAGAASFFGTRAGTLLSNDRRHLVDLSLETADESHFQSILRLDRASIEYIGEKLVLRIGRQAISWGNGLIFQALDPFNPFSPTEIDRDYKTGEDMFYSQWLFDSGSDVQLISVIRRNLQTNDIDENSSSFASKLHARLNLLDLEYDLILSYHYSEPFLGTGVSRDLLGALLRFDISLTEVQHREWILKFTTNIDRSWVLFDTNVYAYLEYFFNELGQNSSNILELNPILVDQIDRGELFTIGKNYLATGLQIEIHPLVNAYPSAVFNLNDESGIFQTRLVYDWAQNLTLFFGVNVPFGPRNSEFGGISLPDQSFLSPTSDLYLRLTYYY